MIRLVADPDGLLVADISARLPGRGIWIQSSGAVLAEAIEDGALARSASHGLKRRIAANGALSALTENIESSLQRQCLSLLGLARGAGGAILGFEKVARALKSGNVGVLVIASDASDDSQSKIEALARASTTPLSVVDVFDRCQLGDAIGAENAVFVALTKGGITDRFLDEALRLVAFRGKALRAILPTEMTGRGNVAPAHDVPGDLEH